MIYNSYQIMQKQMDSIQIKFSKNEERIELESSKLYSLLTSGWFSDEIINIYYQLLSIQFPKVEFLSSHFVTKLMSAKKESRSC